MTLEVGEARVRRSKTVHMREASGAGRQVQEERREEWKRGEETCLMHFLFACFLADVSKSSQNLKRPSCQTKTQSVVLQVKYPVCSAVWCSALTCQRAQRRKQEVAVPASAT